ncbi:MAG: hypothetical protein IID08_02085 [Candidatus Hydrogenedentes bacterium]|nr:hypothetical protein [Candidatus Hydrogenedentota bacterium]
MSRTMNLFDPKPYSARRTLYDPWSNRRSLTLSPRTYLALERLRETLEHLPADAVKAEDGAIRSPERLR